MVYRNPETWKRSTTFISNPFLRGFDLIALCVFPRSVTTPNQRSAYFQLRLTSFDPTPTVRKSQCSSSPMARVLFGAADPPWGPISLICEWSNWVHVHAGARYATTVRPGSRSRIARPYDESRISRRGGGSRLWRAEAFVCIEYRRSCFWWAGEPGHRYHSIMLVLARSPSVVEILGRPWRRWIMTGVMARSSRFLRSLQKQLP